MNAEAPSDADAMVFILHSAFILLH